MRDDVTAATRPELADRLAVVVGGAVGTGLRAGVTALGPAPEIGIPWGTLAANLTGALLLGLLVGAVGTVRGPSGRTVAALGTGLLGAFTTFSALSVETLVLLERSVAVGTGYLVVSLTAGLALAGLGRSGGARWRGEDGP